MYATKIPSDERSLVLRLIEGEEDAFIIGGAMIYNFLMPYVKKMYVTEIKEEFEGDAFFPKISENT